jgi:tRNA (guanosine-2'-O-)-methyltransferase
MKPLGSTDLKRLHRTWRHRTEGRVSLLLDSVQTPYNVGSILRTAAALRVEEIWVTGRTADPTHERTRKTALGSDRFLTFHRIEDVAAACTAAKTAGYRLVGVELADGAGPIQEAGLDVDVCLALGHEDRGLSSACLDACDEVAFIPLLGKIGSLNVATAGAIALYEARRRSWTTEADGPNPLRDGEPTS